MAELRGNEGLTVAMKIMGGSDAMIPLGLAAAIASGTIIGGANYLLIRLLRIPPIIATLSASFVVQSLAIWSNRGIRIKPPDTLADFSTGATLGMLACVGVAAVATYVLCLDLGRGPVAVRDTVRPVGVA